MNNYKDLDGELVDIDGYICIFSNEILDKKDINSRLNIYYLIKREKSALYEISQNKENEAIVGTILYSLPIYLNSKNQTRFVSCFEPLGLIRPLSNFLDMYQ